MASVVTKNDEDRPQFGDVIVIFSILITVCYSAIVYDFHLFYMTMIIFANASLLNRIVYRAKDTIEECVVIGMLICAMATVDLFTVVFLSTPYDTITFVFGLISVVQLMESVKWMDRAFPNAIRLLNDSDKRKYAAKFDMTIVDVERAMNQNNGIFPTMLLENLKSRYYDGTRAHWRHFTKGFLDRLGNVEDPCIETL